MTITNHTSGIAIAAQKAYTNRTDDQAAEQHILARIATLCYDIDANFDSMTSYTSQANTCMERVTDYAARGIAVSDELKNAALNAQRAAEYGVAYEKGAQELRSLLNTAIKMGVWDDSIRSIFDVTPAT